MSAPLSEARNRGDARRRVPPFPRGPIDLNDRDMVARVVFWLRVTFVLQVAILATIVVNLVGLIANLDRLYAGEAALLARIERLEKLSAASR